MLPLRPMPTRAPTCPCFRPAVVLIAALGSLVLSSVGCRDGTGTVQVFLLPEDTITQGIDPGPDPDNMKDGWAARYSRFLVVVGNVRASSTMDSSARLGDPQTYLIDLIAAGSNGVTIDTFTGVEAIRFDRFGYDLVPPTADTVVTGAASADDLAFMLQNGYSIYFEGTLFKADGMSCRPGDPSQCTAEPSVSFRWGLPIATAFDDCGSSDTDLGFAVPSGGTTAIKPTLHGDHIFFNAIPHGTVEPQNRLGQWLADADLDHDGETTLDELRQSRAIDLFPVASYDLSGAPSGIVIATGYDFVNAQLRGIGHFNGDGDCATRTVLK